MYKICLPIVKLFHKKIRTRENSWQKVFTSSIKALSSNDKKVLLFHSASMGEFEQAKPIIEQIKKNFPNCLIVASFYSPSGYENQIDYKFADVKLYLPLDTKKNIKMFIDAIKPEIAIFVRYDLWLNLLNYLQKKSIKLILLNATLPSRSFIRNVFLKQFYRLVYTKFNMIYTIDTMMINYLNNLKIFTTVSLLPDTRYDRVKSAILAKSNEFNWLRKVLSDRLIIVAGSTWQPDEKIISRALSKIRESTNSKFKISVVYVPHEPSEKHIRRLRTFVSNSVLFSEIVNYSDDYQTLSKILDNNVDIVVDSVGILLAMYSVGNVAFVGGGFGTGIHSVIEPAGFGLPIACGPKIDNSKDALVLLEKSYLTVVKNESDLIKWLETFLKDKVDLKAFSSKIKEHFDSNCGATTRITKEIMSLIKSKK
ncbi:MAG: 3-deoxy-D-manno-octulosonic acid transferase [Candidatus Kapaibacteriales bacterium]